MTANHIAVSELFGFMRANPSYSREELENYLDRMMARNGLSMDDLQAAIAERGAENDVEGAALAIVAVNLTHPEQDDEQDDEYHATVSQILNDYCPLLKLANDHDCPDDLRLIADELEEIVLDGADRMMREFPLAI